MRLVVVAELHGQTAQFTPVAPRIRPVTWRKRTIRDSAFLADRVFHVRTRMGSHPGIVPRIFLRSPPRMFQISNMLALDTSILPPQET